MKKLLVLVALGGALLLSQTASADSRFYGRGYNNWGYNNWGYRPSFGYGYNRHYRRNFNRWGGGFYRPYGYRGRNYFNISYGNFYGPYRHRYGYRRNDAGVLLGGIVLGSLITSSARDYRDSYESRRVVYRSPPVSRSREVVYVNRAEPVASSRRRLLRDLEGNCFEVARNQQGDEVRIQLEPQSCNF